jgi:hypothetical protein
MSNSKVAIASKVLKRDDFIHTYRIPFKSLHAFIYEAIFLIPVSYSQVGNSLYYGQVLKTYIAL